MSTNESREQTQARLAAMKPGETFSTATDMPLADVGCHRCPTKMGQHRYVVRIVMGADRKLHSIGEVFCDDGHACELALSNRSNANNCGTNDANPGGG